MRILFITTAHNSLSQRLAVELTRRGHAITLSVGTSPEGMLRDVQRTRPELIIAPMLKSAIPEQVYRRHLCLIVHPGVVGDRGPSSLDWAITLDEARWGVTVLQAEAEMDAGPIWASETFAMPFEPATKSSLYRAQVTEAAVKAVLRAVDRVSDRTFVPQPLDYSHPSVLGRLRPTMRQSERTIDWASHTTDEIVRHVRAADSSPGVLTSLLGQAVYAYGAHAEDLLSGAPGQIVAQRHGAVCVTTVDGGVWLSHLKARAPEHRFAGIKLPAAQVLQPLLRGVPHSHVPIELATDSLSSRVFWREPDCSGGTTQQRVNHHHGPAGCLAKARTYRDISYWEHGAVGYLAFDFYNGAMSTQQCRRLLSALRHAGSRPTHVLCVLGGQDFWSNGIHLNVIEAAADPGAESWGNINAIDDVVLHLLKMPKLVVAGLRGNAGAGGVMLALAADYVYARQGVVLNPHYRGMGNLYGSEYWTYTLPRRVGDELAQQITTACQPMGVDEACQIGMLDGAFGSDAEEFLTQLDARAEALAADPALSIMLESKQRRRRQDERARPLASYRAHELAHMADNFFGPDLSYHQARATFVRKLAATNPANIRPAQLHTELAA
jgi:putative two-component system protein, hydrogenase maturation factor HypX/HoxX